MPFWPLDPGSGMGKKQDPDPGSASGINIPEHISESLEKNFGLKILKFFDADPESFWPGSGIRDGKNSDLGTGINIPDPQHRFLPEKHIKRQATRHDCLPSLPGDEDKWIEKVYSDGKKNYFVLSRLEQTGKNHLYRHEKPKEGTEGDPFSFVLFEAPFTSFSTAGKATPL
jgi:hypothetical protein